MTEPDDLLALAERASRAWGGQPTASYSGNGIAISPDDQFHDAEWGPTRLDERHRIVASGVIDLPAGFQVAPIVQPVSLYGPGFGPPVGRPFTASFGARVEW